MNPSEEQNDAALIARINKHKEKMETHTRIMERHRAIIERHQARCEALEKQHQARQENAAKQEMQTISIDVLGIEVTVKAPPGSRKISISITDSEQVTRAFVDLLSVRPKPSIVLDSAVQSFFDAMSQVPSRPAKKKATSQRFSPIRFTPPKHLLPEQG